MVYCYSANQSTTLKIGLGPKSVRKSRVDSIQKLFFKSTYPNKLYLSVTNMFVRNWELQYLTKIKIP